MKTITACNVKNAKGGHRAGAVAQGGAKKSARHGGAGGERRKRWRAEEVDPMIAAEDAEIKARYSITHMNIQTCEL